MRGSCSGSNLGGVLSGHSVWAVNNNGTKTKPKIKSENLSALLSEVPLVMVLAFFCIKIKSLCVKNRLIYCTLLGWHNGIERLLPCIPLRLAGGWQGSVSWAIYLFMPSLSTILRTCSRDSPVILTTKSADAPSIRALSAISSSLLFTADVISSFTVSTKLASLR